MKKTIALAILFIITISFSHSAWAETYKIGAVFSVTGVASFLGEPEKKTVEMLAEKINSQGGINGNKVKLIIYDSQGDATKARHAVKKLMTRDKVLAVIGPSTSGNSIAVGPLAQKYRTPLLSCASSYKIVTKNRETGEQFPWVFKVAHTDTMAAEAIYTQLNKMNINRIAITSVTSGFGASGRGELIRIAPKYGIKILADEKYGPKDTDMTAQMIKIKALKPQAIINWSTGPSQVTIVRNWKDLDMAHIKLFQSHGFGSKKNIQLAAGAAEGVYLPLSSGNIGQILSANHPQKQVVMSYYNEYQKAYNEPISSFGGHGWDSFMLVVDAIKNVGPDKKKIRDYLEQRKGFVGQHGIFNFSKKDHNGLSKDAFNMLVVKNSDWSLVQ